jgi:hypothetical protein
MNGPLGAALGQEGAPQPTRVEWMLLKGNHVTSRLAP